MSFSRLSLRVSKIEVKLRTLTQQFCFKACGEDFMISNSEEIISRKNYLSREGKDQWSAAQVSYWLIKLHRRPEGICNRRLSALRGQDQLVLGCLSVDWDEGLHLP